MAVIKVGNNSIGKISVIQPYDNPLINASTRPPSNYSDELRPSGWLEMPTLTDNTAYALICVPSGHKDFGVGLFARNGVYNNCPTHIPIDWGDGHSGLFYGTRSDNGNHVGNFGTQHKKYDYDLLPENTEIEVGGFPCRQVIIKIDGSASGITYLSLTRFGGDNFGNTADYGEDNHYYDENNNKVYESPRDNNAINSQTSPLLEVAVSGSNIDEVWIASSNTSYGLNRLLRSAILNVKSFNPYRKFVECQNLVHVDFPSGVTTGKTDFYQMFSVCTKLKSIPFFDTSSATGLYYTFGNCHSMESFPAIDTSNVTNFQGTFHRCLSLEVVPDIDFSNGTNFHSTFSYNHALKSFSSGVDFSSATGCNSMFYYNHNLEGVPEFYAPNLTDCRNMFYYCSSLKQVTVNFPNAYYVDSCFFADLRVEKITIKSLGGNPTNFNRFIRSCHSLKEIDWKSSEADTANGTNFADAFAYNTVMTKYPTITTTAATGCGTMFTANYLLNKVPTIDLSNCTYTSSMFSDCRSLSEVSFKNVLKKPNVQSMFANCYGLKSGPSGFFEGYDSTPSYIRGMFSSCYFLEDVSHYVISGITNSSSTNYQLFQSCQRLQNPPKEINSEYGLNRMFEGCNNLKNVKYDMSQSLNNDYMFYGTTSLDNAQLSGVKSTIRFYNCFLGSGAITDIFNNLETVSNQTVDVRLNYGTSKLHSDTIAIATNKGWTVTT